MASVRGSSGGFLGEYTGATTSQQVYFDAFLVLGTALQHCCPTAESAIAKCTHGVELLASFYRWRRGIGLQTPVGPRGNHWTVLPCPCRVMDFHPLPNHRRRSRLPGCRGIYVLVVFFFFRLVTEVVFSHAFADGFFIFIFHFKSMTSSHYPLDR
jgi:hypothetical protein